MNFTLHLFGCEVLRVDLSRDDELLEDEDEAAPSQLRVGFRGGEQLWTELADREDR